MSKQKTYWSNPTKPKTDFSDISKQKTNFNETGEPTSTSVDPTVNDSRVGVNDSDCSVNGPFYIRTWPTSRIKSAWAE